MWKLYFRMSAEDDEFCFPFFKYEFIYCSLWKALGIMPYKFQYCSSMSIHKFDLNWLLLFIDTIEWFCILSTWFTYLSKLTKKLAISLFMAVLSKSLKSLNFGAKFCQFSLAYSCFTLMLVHHWLDP